MSYTSSPFLLGLAGALLVAAFLPVRLRNWWLILLSIVWLATWNIYVPLIVLPLALLHHYSAVKGHFRLPLFISLALLIALRWEETPLSVGSSFYLLIMTGMVLDVAIRRASTLPLDESVLLCTFFPFLMAGPVERSEDFSRSLRNSKQSWSSVVDGCFIFFVGFLKLAYLREPLEEYQKYLLHDRTTWSLIGASLVTSLSLYVTLSSFADMGRGIARMFGIEVTTAFRSVVFAKDPSDFWERWNRTVAQWFRDYLVFPSLLRWGRKLPANVILFGAFVLLGLWHGFDLEWLVFGIFNGLMVILGSALLKAGMGSKGGRLLVLLLLIGNGFIHIFDKLNELPTQDWYDSEVFYLLGALFIFEWIQEKKGENDFFLHWHPYVKRGFVIVLLLMWIFMVDHRSAPEANELPLYFNL